MKCILKELKDIQVLNPMYGDFKLQVFPFDSSKQLLLPEGFKLWERQVNQMISFIPHQSHAKTHYLTIDSKFFSEDGFLRREGVHIDGNYCVDPNFQMVMWGGSTWSGTSIEDGKVIQKFASPYGTQMPIGEYVSESKGGIICASSFAGCDVWTGDLPKVIGDGGAYDEANLINAEKISLQENKLYFMSSNTPHETTMIPKGTRRTLIRITLNHEYDNSIFTDDLYFALTQSGIGL